MCRWVVHDFEICILRASLMISHPNFILGFSVQSCAKMFAMQGAFDDCFGRSWTSRAEDSCGWWGCPIVSADLVDPTDLRLDDPIQMVWIAFNFQISIWFHFWFDYIWLFDLSFSYLSSFSRFCVCSFDSAEGPAEAPELEDWKTHLSHSRPCLGIGNRWSVVCRRTPKTISMTRLEYIRTS